MGMDFNETAHNKINFKKFRENHDKIDWNASKKKKEKKRMATEEDLANMLAEVYKNDKCRLLDRVKDMGNVPERDQDKELPEEISEPQIEVLEDE